MNPVKKSFVTDLDGSGQRNPNPSTTKDLDVMSELYLSFDKLRSLSGTEDLQRVTHLELCVDTRQNTLGNFGAYLPNLMQLKMNNSLILSVRDLGTTLSHLKVLSMVRCGLMDLDGILSLASLKELYVAYNNISDLSHVSMLEYLEVLDLEGNDVEDLGQMFYLGLCGKLRSLTLEGNPLCICPYVGATQVPEYNYRSEVRKLIPTLQFLDDAPAEEEKPCCCSTTMEDWALLKESIKESTFNTDSSNDCLELLEQRVSSVGDLFQPGSAKRPSTARLSTSLADSRPNSAGSDSDSLNHETSDLTHGVGRVRFCGNPLQAIRARRQKIKEGLSAKSSISRPCTQQSRNVPEPTYNTEGTRCQDRSDLFAELRTWRTEHREDHQPEVLRILHSDNNNDDKDSTNEYDDRGHSFSLLSDKEEEREGRKTFGQKYSEFSDSSLHSSPEGSKPSSFSLSPSPPPRAVAPSTGKKMAHIRGRRLNICNVGVDMCKDEGEILFSDPTALGSDTNLKALSPETGERNPMSPKILHTSQCLGDSPVSSSFSKPCSGISHFISEHKPIICSITTERLLPSPRPYTARAALQRLPVLPDKGNMHLN